MLCVMCDVDDTLCPTFDAQAKHCYVMQKLFHVLQKSNEVDLHIVTGRVETRREETHADLKKIGLEIGDNKLHLKPDANWEDGAWKLWMAAKLHADVVLDNSSRVQPWLEGATVTFLKVTEARREDGRA
jgi:hypothetical protein